MTALGADSLGPVSLVVGCRKQMVQLIEDKGSDKTAAAAADAAVVAVAGGAAAVGGGNGLHLPLLSCTCVGELRSCFGRPWHLGHLAANNKA